MAANTNSQQFPFCIGAGRVYRGVPPISDPRVRAAMQHSCNTLQLGQQTTLKPRQPQLSGGAGFQQVLAFDEVNHQLGEEVRNKIDAGANRALEGRWSTKKSTVGLFKSLAQGGQPRDDCSASII